MTTSILINALGQALFESCGQALLIYVALQLFMQFFPAVGSKYKYDINYLGLTIICCWFLANLVKIYLHNLALPHYSITAGMGAMQYPIAAHTPTLLQQAQAFIATYAKYITGLYMMGLVLHAFRLLGGFMHIHHISRPKNLLQDSVWSAKADELIKKLKIAKKVSLYFSEQVQIPLTIGHLKPIIIFPFALINNLDNSQVEAILLHELAHIKRHDYLLNILQCIMETILCFNPFVWLISKTIRQEREYCCDDVVVDEEEYSNYTYASALFIVAQQNSQSYALAMASAGSKKYPLLNRIKRLNNMKTNESLPKFNLAVIIAIAAIGVLLTWGLPQYSVAKTKINEIATHIKTHLNQLTVEAPVKVTIAPVAEPTPPAPPAPATEARKPKTFAVIVDTAGNKSLDDTLKNKKKKFQIVLNDNGVTRMYNSIDELPADDKKEFLEENPSFAPFAGMHLDMDSMRFAMNEKFRMNPKFQKQMLAMKLNSEAMAKQFNKPEWRKKMADMRFQSEKMSREFDKPEFRKQVEDMKIQAEKMAQDYNNNPEFKKQMEDMREQAEKMHEDFDKNPEFHKQMEDMKIQAEKMGREAASPRFHKQVEAMKIQAEIMRREMNDPKWKKQMEKINKESKKIQEEVEKEMRDNPEWRKAHEDMELRVKGEIRDKVDDEHEKAEKAAQDSTKN